MRSSSNGSDESRRTLVARVDARLGPCGGLTLSTLVTLAVIPGPYSALKSGARLTRPRLKEFQMRRWLAGVLTGLVGVGAAWAADGPYRFVKEIPIGGAGGWDYITVDAAAHRVYVSHGTHVVVADV